MDELPETQDTLEGNALQKAQYVFQKFNVPCSQTIQDWK